MRYGVVLTGVGPMADPERLVRAARKADQLGFHSLWLYEHVAFPTRISEAYGKLPFTPETAFLDPITTLSYLAAETRQEVPSATAVVVERFEERENLTYIAAEIIVERDGQKAILIGAGGEMLKRIGTLARMDIEKLLGRKVYLELFVKVRERWRDNPRFLDELDWRKMVGE